MTTEPAKPRYLVEVARRNRIYYYWQPNKALRQQGWLPRSLAARPDPSFPSRYDQACAEAAAINAQLDGERESGGSDAASRKKGTIAWLIAQFEQDRRYLRLRPKTREGYDQLMGVIGAKFGDAPIRALTRPVLEKWYNRLYQRTPWQANALMAMCRRLLHVAWTLGEIAVNPASKMELAGCDPRQQLWEEDDLDYFSRMAIWLGRRSVAIATLLGSEIGQREADILAIRWTQYRDGKIRLQQGKTRKWVEIDCTIELRGLLDEERRQVVQRLEGDGRGIAQALAATPIVVSEETGRPYKTHNFCHIFADLRSAAEIEDLRFQDLRRTCVVNLARAGATPAEIAAITGHEIGRVVKILETYLPRDGIMAEHAIVKLEAWKAARANRSGTEV